MRLIDVDALKEIINTKRVVGRFNTIQLIDNAPTIELDKVTEAHEDIGYERGFRDGYAQAVEENTGEWIPIAERLPKISERVLLTMNNGEVYIGHLHTYKGEFGWTLEPTSLSYIYPSASAVAWMPLPNPYKKGEEE